MNERPARWVQNPDRPNPPHPDSKGRVSRSVAIVENFPEGPILQPTRVSSLDELGEVFGRQALDWPCTLGARMYFSHGGTDALVTRAGGPEPSLASELIVGISMLAMTSEWWDFLCLTTLSRLDDVDFEVVVRHAKLLCDRMDRGVEIFDPRNVLVDLQL